MEFVMIGLLALTLAAQLTGWMLLRRKIREMQQRLARVLVAQGTVRESLETLLHREDVAKALEGLLAEEVRTRESLREIWTSLETLLRREDAAKAVKELEALLKTAPPSLTPNEELRLSQAVEEGMANILQYAAGKAPGVEVRL